MHSSTHRLRCSCGAVSLVHRQMCILLLIAAIGEVIWAARALDMSKVKLKSSSSGELCSRCCS